MEPKKRRRDWVVWLVVALLPLSYALSIGPACWLVTREVVPFRVAKSAYAPVVRCVSLTPEPLQRIVQGYCGRAGPLKSRKWGRHRFNGTETPLQDMQLAVAYEDRKWNAP